LTLNGLHGVIPEDGTLQTTTNTKFILGKFNGTEPLDVCLETNLVPESYLENADSYSAREEMSPEYSVRYSE
jgi:hypothetical protein